MVSVYSSKHFWTDASEVWKLFFEMHLVLDIQTIFKLQKLHCKNFWGEYIKNESYKSYLDNKVKTAIFLAAPQSHVHFGFLRPTFFYVPDRVRK